MTSRIMQRSPSTLNLRIHVRTFGDQQFDDFLVTPISRTMQRSTTQISINIHIRTSSQVLFDCFDVSFVSSLVN